MATSGLAAVPATLPSGTVVGRIAIGSGPAEALPVAILALSLGTPTIYVSTIVGTNTITGASQAPLPAQPLLAGQLVYLIPAATNTGAVTLNRDALGAKSIIQNGVALTGGELRINVPTVLFYDGTQYNILSIVTPAANFISAETGIGGTSTTVVVAHGLGVIPRSIYLALRCKTAEFGYSINDEVQIASSTLYSVYADVTNVGIVQSTNPLQITRRDTFAVATVTSANWKYVVRAWV